jgi:hypothetical protein
MEQCLQESGSSIQLIMRFRTALGHLFAPGEICNEDLTKMVPLVERASDLLEPSSSPLLTRFRTGLGNFFAIKNPDDETLAKMVPLVEKAADIRKTQKRLETHSEHATCHAERNRHGKRKLPNCFQSESQSVDQGLGAYFGPNESHADKPTLRHLLDTQQVHTFPFGGIADIPIASFANIQQRVEAAHRAVILHEVLIQTLRSVGVEDGIWTTKFDEAIRIASNLDILTSTEATFFHSSRLE